MANKEDIDTGLALFLLCCTAGIGLVIYLLILAAKPADRCIFCNNIIGPVPSNNNVGYIAPPQNQPRSVPRPVSTYQNANVQSRNQSQTPTNTIIDESTGEEIVSSTKRFCPLCGNAFDLGQKFCAGCGGDLTSIKN